jgi:hypothetical protein
MEFQLWVNGELLATKAVHVAKVEEQNPSLPGTTPE